MICKLGKYSERGITVCHMFAKNMLPVCQVACSSNCLWRDLFSDHIQEAGTAYPLRAPEFTRSFWWGPCCSYFLFFVFPHKKRSFVRLYLQLFVGEIMSCLRCLCLFTHNGVQLIVCCVFDLFFFLLCTLWVSLDCSFLIVLPCSLFIYLDQTRVCTCVD